MCRIALVPCTTSTSARSPTRPHRRGTTIAGAAPLFPHCFKSDLTLRPHQSATPTVPKRYKWNRPRRNTPSTWLLLIFLEILILIHFK